MHPTTVYMHPRLKVKGQGLNIFCGEVSGGQYNTYGRKAFAERSQVRISLNKSEEIYVKRFLEIRRMERISAW